MERMNCQRILTASLIGALVAGAVPTLATAQPAAPSYAQPAYAPPDRVTKGNGGEYVVAPVTVPARGPTRRFAADRTVRTVRGEQLERMQAKTAVEALAETAGVAVQKTNRGSGSPLLRGLIGPSNLLVVDGIRFSNATFRTGPNQYLALLDPASFAGYEALIGPASVVYGSDAMGGVLAARAFAFRATDGAGGTAGLTLASADLSASTYGSANLRKGPLAVQFGGVLRRHDSLTTGGGTVAPLSDYLSGAWRLRARYDLTPTTSIGAHWYGSRIRDAGRTDQLSTGRIRLYDNDSDLGWLELRHRPKQGALHSLRAVVSLHRTHEDVERFRCATSALGDGQPCIDASLPARHTDSVVPGLPVTRQEHNRDTVWSPGALLQARWKISPKVRVTSGAELQHDMVSSTKRERRSDKNAWAYTTLDRGNFSDGSTWTQGGVFGLVDADLLGDDKGKLALTGGVRGALFSAHADGVPTFGTIDYSHVGVVGSLGLKWVAPNAMVYANASQGLRAPNLQESTVLGDTGSTIDVPNSNLTPESSVALELGTRLRGKCGDVHLAGFANLLRDIIDSEDVPESEFAGLGLNSATVGTKPVRRRVNRDAGRFYGAELQGRIKPFAGGTLWARGSYIQGEVDRPSGATPSRRNPPPMGSAGLRVRPPSQPELYVEVFSLFAARADRLHPDDEADLRICAVPGQPDKTFSALGQTCSGTPGWATANVRAGYRFGDKMRLDVAGLNLLDAAYRYHGSGIDEPGRGVRVSLTSRF